MNIIKSNNIEDILALSLIPYEVLTYQQKANLLFKCNFDIKKIFNLNEKDFKVLINKTNLTSLNYQQYYKKAKELIQRKVKFVTADSDYFPFNCWNQDNIYDDNLIEQCKLLPFLLFYEGDISILKSAKISIIGTRKPHLICESFTKYIVESLGKSVVSGFAMGIDSIAHQVANQLNLPTIAVFGCGTNIIYPKGNLELYKKLIQKDFLILSEFPPDTIPKKYYFPIRNRIIAALSDDVICIQAGMKSGALITIKFANQLKKRVFVFYPNLPGFEGNIDLYKKNKAKLLYGYNNNLFFIKNPEIFDIYYEKNKYEDKIDEILIDFSKSVLSDNAELSFLRVIYENPYKSLEFYSGLLSLNTQKSLITFNNLLEKNYIIVDKMNNIYPNYIKNPLKLLIN